MKFEPEAHIICFSWLKELARARGITNLAAQNAFFLIYGYTVNTTARCFYGTLEVVKYWTEAASETSARKYLVDLETAGLIEKMSVIYKNRPRPAYRARLDVAEAFRRALMNAATADAQAVDVPHEPAAEELTPQNLTPQKLTRQNLTPQILISDPSNFDGNNIEYNINKNIVNNARTHERETADENHGRRLAEASLQPEPKQATQKRQEPPTVETVSNYLQSLGNCPNKAIAEEIAESFVNANEGMGWTKNGHPIVSWKPLAKNYMVSYIRNQYQNPATPKREPQKRTEPKAAAPKEESLEEQKTKIMDFYHAMREQYGEEEASAMTERDVARRHPEIRHWWRQFTYRKDSKQ